MFSFFAFSLVASPSVLWYCWLGLLLWPVKTVSHITYTVLAGTSNTAQSNPIKEPLTCVPTVSLSSNSWLMLAYSAVVHAVVVRWSAWISGLATEPLNLCVVLHQCQAATSVLFQSFLSSIFQLFTL